MWVLASRGWRSQDRPAVLHAYDAANIGRELFNSEQNAARDRTGMALRFVIPTIANGRVYVAQSVRWTRTGCSRPRNEVAPSYLDGLRNVVLRGLLPSLGAG